MNKLIFVKEYQKAQTLLEELILDEDLGENMLIHLRRIELASKLNTLGSLKPQYEAMQSSAPEKVLPPVCMVLIDQHNDAISSEEAVGQYQNILKKFGPNPAVYYGLGFAMEMSSNFERALRNYEQCIKLDHAWYPAYFGMSQIYYNLQNDERGDHYFFLFEEIAPYNVYGNFETHKRLSDHYLQEENYDLAERAIIYLSEWWMDNKSFCPIEIQIYERLATAKIADYKGDANRAEQRRYQGNLLARRALESEDEPDSVLLFIAKTLEDFSELKLALEFYKKILARDIENPEIVQKIGAQFLSMGQADLARELFENAYEHHPDNPEVRFCWLVSGLRSAGVNIEEYLVEKERLKAITDSHGDKVELLSTLHSLLAKYEDDPDVHAQMAEIHLRMGNLDRAKNHFEKMYQLDSGSFVTRMRYVAYLMNDEEHDKAKQILDGIPSSAKLSSDMKAELLWLKSNYSAKNGDYKGALASINQVLKHDPWNITYLVQQAIILSEIHQEKVDFSLNDKVLKCLAKNIEEGLDWEDFSRRTERIAQAKILELNYTRCKIRFLYANGDEENLKSLVQSACHLDAGRCTFDFLKLLNTNFDTPYIYWALGRLYKELWQLEAASIWFEQILAHLDATERHKARAYQELADCLNWLGNQLDRAVEYAKFSLDLNASDRDRSMLALAHSYLNKGEVRHAEAYLHELDPSDPDVRYLQGLLLYRNGSSSRANEVWKPLLTLPVDSIRLHIIKQQVLKYYFDKQPYKTIN